MAIFEVYFQKYQNAYVKHDDGTRITEQDADLCVKQALLLMMYIVSKKKMYNNSRRNYDEMNNREEIYSYLKQYDREYSLAKTVKKEIE